MKINNDKLKQSRAQFCQLAITDPKKAADKLKRLATGLEHCRNTSDTINALSNIFAVSEITIFRDLRRS